MAAETPEYEIRLMRKEDINQVLDLCREGRILEGTHCIDTWFEYDPEGFYVAVTKEGTVIGACAGVFQHADLAVVGLYEVKQTFQRRGIGRKLWNKVMERVGDRNAGLTSVTKMVQTYKDRAGFPIQSGWNSVVCASKNIKIPDITDEASDTSVFVVSSDDVETINGIIEFDSSVYGFSRGRFIPIMCREQDSVTVVAVRKSDNCVCGYGNIKETWTGESLIGPLIANNHSIAELILYKLVESFPVAQRGVTLMALDCNQAAIDFVGKLGFKRLVDLPQLYRKAAVDVQFNKIFAQTNLNFSVF